MRAVAVALLGAGLGIFAVSLSGALASFFWPLAAHGVLRGALVAGGIAALAAAAAPPSWRALLGRRRALLAATGLAAAAVAALATQPLARVLHPGAGLGLRSFPLVYLATLALPFAAAGIALVTWCDERAGRRLGLFIAGIGAGVLGAAVIHAAAGASLRPWSGGPLLEFSAAGRRIREISIDRGLRRFLITPRGASLAFAPDAGERKRRILLLGLENGPILARLLKLPQARITILEEDQTLVRAVLARWPALAQATAAGKVVVVGGAERWALARIPGRFDLIVLAESWTAGAYHARALSHRRELRWTTEALAACLSRLKPRGRLLVQRTGIGRVVATLREASGLPAAEFGRRLVVLGRHGRIVSECWYSPSGFDSRQAQETVRWYRRRTGVLLLYNPLEAPGQSFYTSLVRGERPRGLAFSTPLDLSPPLDERPFFDNVERLMLSPRGRALPEELEPLEEAATLRIFPRANQGLWGILLGGLALTAALGVAQRAAGGRARAPARFPSAAFWGGAAAGLLLEAFAAWCEYLAPSAFAAAAAGSALLVGIGAGWACAPGSQPGWRQRAPLAAVALSFGAAGYRLLPAALRFGPAVGAAAVIGAGAMVGVALGRVLGAGTAGPVAGGSGPGGLRCGAGLVAAALAAVGASLAAPHFGYPLLWVLGAVALLAPAVGRGKAAPADRASAT